MQANWKKTTITFILGSDQHPVRIAIANGVAEPEIAKIEAFGSYLANLTGLPFQHAAVATVNDVA